MGSNIKVYPNPADHRGQVSVELPVPHQLSRIHLTSVSGKEVAVFPLSANQAELQITGLSAGTYVLSARDEAGVVFGVRRVVVW
jgi:hypothetical protein